ncbi:MAG: hypothetical protein R3231_09630 [bacterium]|nr:hypothetical protein [bacterium]
MAKKTQNVDNYCNNLFTQLTEIKGQIDGFIKQVEGFSGNESEHIRSHAEHLREINKTIDWKLEIFTKSCPLDSGGYDKDAITGAGVPTGKRKIAGGYAGG